MKPFSRIFQQSTKWGILRLKICIVWRERYEKGRPQLRLWETILYSGRMKFSQFEMSRQTKETWGSEGRGPCHRGSDEPPASCCLGNRGASCCHGSGHLSMIFYVRVRADNYWILSYKKVTFVLHNYGTGIFYVLSREWPSYPNEIKGAVSAAATTNHLLS